MTTAGRSVVGVLAGGQHPGEGERARHGPQNSWMAREGTCSEKWLWNLAVDTWVRRPGQSSGVPGNWPSNAGRRDAHEHQQTMGK
jgi:hypothetical protein